MNKQQALIELESWKVMYDKCEAVSKPLRELIGDLSESNLYQAIWESFDFATKQLNERVCIDEVERLNNPLEYFAYLCDMGNDPHQVTKNGETRILRTLDDVLWCMGY